MTKSEENVVKSSVNLVSAFTQKSESVHEGVQQLKIIQGS
jgi:hypothetical protein